jgi:hypothetical protein
MKSVKKRETQKKNDPVIFEKLGSSIGELEKKTG